MNSAESAALGLVCRERGWTAAPDGESADLVLLNTCSVRATAEKRVFGRLALYGSLKKKRKAPERPLTLVAAGCMAQRLGEKLRDQVPAVDYVMGTSARSMFPLILEAAEKGLSPEQGREWIGLADDPGGAPRGAGKERVFSFSPFHLEEGEGGARPFRSFVPIMHGCNNFCSYCIVPHVRGREISRSPASIFGELRLLEERGVREITLLGQNVNTYHWEGPVPGRNRQRPEEGLVDFPGLLEAIARELEGSSIRWVRFLSANPKDFSPGTIRVMAENPLFCRHLHLCVQHGSNRILSAMNRAYTREAYLELVRKIRSALPGITLSTDFLIGFPGETEEDLGLTLELMEEVKFLYAYMYHYNPREGTAAYNLPGRIDEALKRERLSRVITRQKRHTAELLKSRIGSREKVLIEGISRKNADELITRTERDEMAVAPGRPSMIGSFAELSLSGLRGNTFFAKELTLCPGV
jgi:tRNA-2-methylthio-N6-dimethylallyladenosine synthase